MAKKFKTDLTQTPHYSGPVGGWGSLRGIVEIWQEERSRPETLRALARQNKPGGFMCVACAWTKPAKHKPLEFCENGAKATLWETTSRRCGPEIFAQHTLTEMRTWPDYDLEQQGRLTHPMRYARELDKYVPCTWDDAFAEIGDALRAIDPEKAAFYSSGRASLETSYLYALFARVYGHNNLPDSSNMCHETTSVALTETIGVGVGTVVLDDFEHCDAIFFFGQNTGSNSPRLLHTLQDAVKRGVKIVTFNPVRERGLERFVSPQNPLQMLTGHATPISDQYYQVRPGGDLAVLLGLCKYVLGADDAAMRDGRERVLDTAFIAEHTNGFEAFVKRVRALEWAEIEREAGLTRIQIEAAGLTYVQAQRVIGIYGMGLTQQRHGFENIAVYINLLLMRGNIGRIGAGMSPVRGHSNVQGQRTVGISEKPELVPLDRLKELFDFEPPRQKGMNTVEVCESLLNGGLEAFVGLGGNFLRAVPDTNPIEQAWPKLKLTVQIATRLNRSHLVNGATAFLLPCLGRSEKDLQNGTLQVVTMEDSLSCIHGSRGYQTPASAHLKSEIAIVAGIAQATLNSRPALRWVDWTNDYGLVRDLIEQTYPDKFTAFNQRMFTPGGFYKGNPARERVWKTPSGKAEFTTPLMTTAAGFSDTEGRFRLITMRSNDQFNTTIYGYSDRLRGIEGRRDVLLINANDMSLAGLSAGQRVALVGDASDGVTRRVEGLVVTPFNLPDGCVGAYYPETNPLVPLWYHDERSKTPAGKCVPVRISTDVF